MIIPVLEPVGEGGGLGCPRRVVDLVGWCGPESCVRLFGGGPCPFAASLPMVCSKTRKQNVMCVCVCVRV